MPVHDLVLNTRDISLTRPLDQMSGGDTQRRLVHSELRAHVRQESIFIREEAGGVAERVLITRMLFQPKDREGNTLDFESGDFIEFPDYRGVPQTRQITSVDPVTANGVLDHFIVLAERP